MSRVAHSLLFVPGHRPERFDKACAAGADVTLVDLEDAVAPDAKDEARRTVREFLAGLPAAVDGEVEIWVRVNGDGLAGQCHRFPSPLCSASKKEAALRHKPKDRFTRCEWLCLSGGGQAANSRGD